MIRNMILCQGRHECPDIQTRDGAIFDYSLTPELITNPYGLEAVAMKRLQQAFPGDGECFLNLTVSGLTVALIATLNACHQLGIHVTLLHFDRATGGYFTQGVD